ncbi:DUF6541 family protein [Microbacterium rhizomatis]|uniref:Uncharacterized protein n=1 Tax=Microbacterium rhizomatis TaxID=1631477 RepID=A0A5J5J5B7_9MICO|nr:DUF6541 family protein [Microbacterium rhizomatis]KAA9111230.1 hypothetical protein F6B43_06455 [Microbacterium rhizomatis]
MTWLPFVLSALVAIGVLAVVGGSLSWAAGLRGFWAVAAAPAFAVTVVAIASIVAPWVGLGWSVLPVLIVAVVLGAVVFFIRRRWVRRPELARRPFDGWLVGAVVLGIMFLAWRVVVVIGEPTNFSQTFDNVFHLNAVRFVLSTGNASSLHLGLMTSPSGSLPFYPAAWHAFVALVLEITGASVPVGVNAVNLVIAAVIWPLGVVLLTRTLFGPRPLLTVAAVVVACGVPAFPFLLMDYGVLYPFLFGLALVPVALAAALEALGLSAVRTLPEPWWALLLAGTLPGIALAHPGAFVAVLALTLPMTVVFAWRLFRGATARRRVAVVVGFAAYLALGLVLLRVLRPPADARGWPPALSIPDAVGQVATASMWYAIPVTAVAVAVLCGILAALIQRSTPGLLSLSMYVIAAGLYVVVSALTFQPLRDILTGSWYNNIPRLAAILPLTMVPLAAHGVDRAWAAVTRVVRPVGPTARRVAGVVAAIVAAAAIVSVLSGPVVTITGYISAGYRITPDSALVSTDEYALLQRLDQHVPADATVAGSAWTGAGLAYALADRWVLMPHTLTEVSADTQTINDGLGHAVAGGAVCAALERENVRFVLDFGQREIFPGEHVYPGLQNLAESPAVRLVDSEGEARLYEVIACG